MKNTEELTCAELIKLALSKHASIFSQLVYLAGMRDESTGDYRDTTLAFMFGEEEVNRVVREGHERTFAAWLALTLEQQTADLPQHLAGTAANRLESLKEWMERKQYERLIPNGVTAAERLLFLSDMEIILPLLDAQG